MCHNAGTLFQCDVVLWIVSDPEMGECKMSKTYYWPGPSPRSTNRDKRQPQVININLMFYQHYGNILKKISLYERKETRSCKVSFTF